jgi:glycosyltransferase involved in cell wall biosynthesis
MKISVAIPVYNSARTIRMTLDSVLAQTRPADEILVLDDGSTDKTLSILKSYGTRITTIAQRNGGPAVARNILCGRATGNLVAFLDSDDLWHPEYLENQERLFQAHPRAAALFVGHVDLLGYGPINWNTNPDAEARAEVMQSLDFLSRYNARPGPFNMSYCCVPKAVLTKIGAEPFRGTTSHAHPWAEDCYFHNRLALEGPVVYFPRRLAAYRMNSGSVSWDQLRWTAAQVSALEFLANVATDSWQPYHNAFRRILSSKRRVHAKVLLGAGRKADAREELRRSIPEALQDSAAVAKSMTLLVASYLPRALQPKWPPRYRVGHQSIGSEVRQPAA